MPRAFFVFLPMFALLLELFYRKEGYYIDHLIFALYYHAFVFLGFAALFVVGHSRPLLSGWLTLPLNLALTTWLVACLPMALRRVYGGSRLKTAAKTAGLGVLYLAVFGLLGMPLVMTVAMLTF